MSIDPANPFPLPAANVPDYVGSAVKTLTAPNEGPRTIPFNLSGIATTRTYIISIPPWDGNRGLSQICSISIDGGISMPQTTPSSLSLYFPDTQYSVDVPFGFSGVVPVITNGLIFFVYAPSGIGAIRINVNNFFIPPALNTVNTNFNSINGSPITSSSISGGRQSISIGAQTLSPIVVGFGGVAQPVSVSSLPASTLTTRLDNFASSVRNAVGIAAAGVVTVRLVTGAGVLRHCYAWIETITAGGAGATAVCGILLDGATLYPVRTIQLGAGANLMNLSLFETTGIAIAYAASVDLYANVFAGAVAGGVLEGGCGG